MGKCIVASGKKGESLCNVKNLQSDGYDNLWVALLLISSLDLIFTLPLFFLWTELSSYILRN